MPSTTLSGARDYLANNSALRLRYFNISTEVHIKSYSRTFGVIIVETEY